jgi:hypothetical protein
VIANYARFISSVVIYFASQIFSQMNKFFLGSSDASPWNSGNLIMGSWPTILNYVELIPLHYVDIWMLILELNPPVASPCLDAFPVVFFPLKFGCLNASVLSGVLVTHWVVGSTLMVIWIGVLPFVSTFGPHFFLSYVSHRISSICITAWRSSTYSSLLANPSLSAMDLFLLFILYW